MSLLAKIFGNANEKYIKDILPLVERMSAAEKDFLKLPQEKLKEKTQEFKKLIENGSSLNDILPEAFALVREASKRTLGQRHFDVQMLGGIILHQGKIAEMKTGEGKTLTATLPLYLNALKEKGCHLITVNDYLARRDAVWMGQIYHLLGLTIGVLNHEQSFLYDPEYKIKSQSSNSNDERDETRDVLGSFKIIESYLRPCSRKEAYLADITYGTNNEYGFDYLKDNMAYDLSQHVQRDYNFAIVDEVDSILIDEARTPLIISAPDMESSKWYLEFSKIIPKLDSKIDFEIDEKMKVATLTEAGVNKIESILGAGNIYEEKGIKYVHHLEQALRAETLFKKDRDYVIKDGQVIIVDEFTGRLMPGRRWSGGLHQAIEAKERVNVQPESLTLASITFQNYFRMYKKLSGMTGTALTSAEEFDKVYKLEVVSIPTNKPMIRRDLPDKIFKTEQGKFQALVKEIKERHCKGQPVLVGTTSIVKNEYLGKLLQIEGIAHQILNAKHHEKEGEIIAQAGKLSQVTIATNMAGRGVDITLGGNPQNTEEVEKIKQFGGLHVIGTERHEARRIDNQLRGRTGRQGDPGSSQFFVSLEDDLMRIFGGDRIKSLMNALKIPENEAIESRLVSKAIEEAQSKVEGMNFDLRKHVLEYDDVMNKHREVIYKKRREFLEIKNWESIIGGWTQDEEQKKLLNDKQKELAENFDQVVKFVALRTLDMLWIEHLENMEYLRDSVRLRAYGQRDPLVEYKTEGHKMFQQLLQNFEKTVVETILKASLKQENQGLKIQNSEKIQNSNVQKIGRNDLCPCGSGKKYKKCHGK